MNILLAFKAEPDAGMLAEKEWQDSFLKPKSHEIAQPVQCPFIPHAQRG